MIFTKEQIDEIGRRLAQNGAKDTDLPYATLPLTGEETLAIVQKEHNVQLPLKEASSVLKDGVVTSDKLAANAVVNGKIAVEAVNWDNLTEDVQRIILESGGGGTGVALSKEFGYSDLVGITQKTLTLAKNSIEDNIDNIETDVSLLRSEYNNINHKVNVNTGDIQEISNTVAANSEIEAEHYASTHNAITAHDLELNNLDNAVNTLNDKIDAKVVEVGGVVWDTEPVEESTNGITSGAVYNALQGISDIDDLYQKTVHIVPQSLTAAQKQQAKTNLGMGDYNTLTDSDFEDGAIQVSYIQDGTTIYNYIEGEQSSIVRVTPTLNYKHIILDVTAGSSIKIFGSCYYTPSALYVIIRKTDNIVTDIAEPQTVATDGITLTVQHDSYILISGLVDTTHHLKVEYDNFIQKVQVAQRKPLQYGIIPGEAKFSIVTTDSSYFYASLAPCTIWYNQTIILEDTVTLQKAKGTLGVTTVAYDTENGILVELNPTCEQLLGDEFVPVALVDWTNKKILEANFSSFIKDGDTITIKPAGELESLQAQITNNASTISEQLETCSMLSSRGITLIKNHACSWHLDGTYSFVEIPTFDTLLVQYPNNATGFTVEGIIPGRIFYCNEVGLPTVGVAEEGNIIGSNTTFTVLKGTKMLSINISKSSNIEQGQTEVDYSKTCIEFDYPSETHGTYEIKRNALVSWVARSGTYVFLGYPTDDRYDNIWIDLSDNNISSITVEGINATRFHYLSEWGTPTEETWLGTNTTGMVMKGAKMASLTVTHSLNNVPPDTEVNYDDLEISFTYNEKGGVSANKLMTVTVNKANGNAIIRTQYNKEKDLVIAMSPYTATTEAMVIKNVYLGESNEETSDIMNNINRIQTPMDITSAINREGFYAEYAQHGYAALGVNKAGHGISEEAIGSVYIDDQSRNFTLIHVKDENNLIFQPEIDTSGEYPTPVWKWMDTTNPNPTTLTKVSGSSPVQSITSFTCFREDMKIQVTSERKFLVDGIDVESGTYGCDDFSVAETLLGYDVVGTEWYPELIFGDPLVKINTSYNFHGASVTCNRMVEFLKKIITGNFAGWMPILPAKDGYTKWSILPKTANYKLPFETPSGGIKVFRKNTDLINTDNLPERVVTYLYDSQEDNYLVGCAAGHFLNRGISRGTIRNTNVPADRLVIDYDATATPNKFYCHLIRSELHKVFNAGDYLEHSGYMTWFDPTENPDNCKVYWYKDGNSYVVYVDVYAVSQSVSGVLKVKVPNFMEGLSVSNTLENANCECETDVVTNGYLLLTPNLSVGQAGYIVLRLS